MRKIYFVLFFISLFGISVLKAQTGTTCANAHVINSLPFTVTGLATAGTSYSSLPCSGTGFNNYMSGADYVFSFTPATTQNVSIAVTNSGLGVGLFVISACPDNGAVTCIQNNNSITGNPSLTDVSLTAGTNYYIVVSSNSIISAQTNFDISVSSCTTTPTASFTYTVNNFTVDFQNTSTDATTYGWFFGDEAFPLFPTDTVANPSHTYNATGTYDVTLIASSVCGSDTIVVPVTILCNQPAPVPSFTYNNTNLDVTFTNTSSNAVTYEWIFGEEPLPVPNAWFWSDSTTNPQHTYQAYGSYDVYLAAFNSCGESDTVMINITLTCPGVIPVASFTYSANNLDVAFQSTSTGANTYGWYFGDEFLPFQPTDTTVNPTHTYAQTGSYNVMLIVSNECGSDTANQTIDITCTAPVADAQFTYAVTNLDVTFTNISVNGVSYKWLFGDGIENWLLADTTSNPQHTYQSYGSYTVSMVALNACGEGDTIVTDITLVCPGTIPNADFTYVQNAGTVQFTNTSTGTQVSYGWYFGDEIFPITPTETSPNPTHTYLTDGTYNVQFIVTNECGSDTAFQQIIISGTKVNMINGESKIALWPNPVKSSLFVSAETASVVTITDVCGKIIYYENLPLNNTVINLENFDSGVYIVSVKNSRETIVKSIVKE